MFYKGFYLSPSKINTFYTCPYQYWAKYIAQLPEIITPTGPRLFGNMVHNIIVCYYDKINDKTPLLEAYSKIEEAFVEGADYRTGKRTKTLKTIQRNFMKFEKERIEAKKPKPKLIEKKLKSDLFPDLPPFGGIIDAYFEDDGLCVDWKTGSYEEMDESRMIQGKVYEMVLKDNGYPVEKVLFNNLNLGRRLTLPQITDGWLETKVKHMISVIKSGRFVPQESGLCNGWCGYVLSCNTRHKCPWGETVG